MSSNQTAAAQGTRSSTRMSTQQIAICSLLCAMNVVFARFFTAMPSAVSRFSIEAVPIILAGYFYGPVSGMIVGFVGDTVGCLFSAYGWNPIISVSPMLMGVFAGLLRPLAYSVEKPRDIWRVALTILPGKILGSVVWTSLCLVWLGYSKKGVGALMAARAIEAGLEWILDSVIVFLLIRTGVFRRAKVFPPSRKRRSLKTAPNIVRLLSGAMLLIQIIVLSIGDLLGALGFMDTTLSLSTRIGSAALYLIPTMLAIILFAASVGMTNRQTKPAEC